MARRLGLRFGELAIRGETKVGELAQFYELDLGEVEPEVALADWAAAGSAGSPRSTRSSRSPAETWWSAGSSPVGSPAWGCSSTRLLQEPDEKLLPGWRRRWTSSAASGNGWRACGRAEKGPEPCAYPLAGRD